MPSISKGISQPKKKIKTLRKINPLIFSGLTCLVGKNLFTRAKSTRKTKTTKKIFSIVKNKNRVIVIILLPQVLRSFLKKKKKTFSRLSISTASEKVITLSNVLKKKIQKTSISLDNLYGGNYS